MIGTSFGREMGQKIIEVDKKDINVYISVLLIFEKNLCMYNFFNVNRDFLCSEIIGISCLYFNENFK